MRSSKSSRRQRPDQIPTIRIRELRYDEARRRLESELERCFREGVLRVAVLHGIGSGTLKALTLALAAELGYASVVEQQLHVNDGVTLLDLAAPDRHTIQRYLKES